MPEQTPPADTPLDLVLDADREIARVGADDPYPFYELLHRIAGRIAPVDAFYVCLYSEADQSLLFPYNYDSGVYDYPSTFPLGDGPTSWVIRHKEPFVWNTQQEARDLRRIAFGDTATLSHSAVSLPIPAAPPDAPLLGVLSAQCYTPHAYDAQARRLFQWLADRAGVALDRAQARAREAGHQQQSAWIADQCVQIVNRLSRDAQALPGLIPPDQTALRDAATGLLRACCRAQTETNELPLRAKTLPAPAPADCLAAFTDREREIVPLLRAGHANAEIARRLCMAPDTVKYHLKSIYVKLGVGSRLQAVQKLNAAAPPNDSSGR